MAGFPDHGAGPCARRNGRGRLLAALLLLFGLTLWVLVPMLLEGWRESDYLLLAGTGMLILVTGGLLRAAITRWRSPVSA